MKYNVEQFITNTQGQYSASVAATFDDFDGAKVNYHQSLAALHNADDVLIAVVKIVDEFGNDIPGYREVIDNTPEPIEEETATE
jgi:hypothetical protein